MIDPKEKMINQIMGYIYKDKTSQSTIRLNFTNIFKVLADFGYNLPYEGFEKHLQELLNIRLVGAIINPGLKYSVAVMVAELAEKMHISTEVINEYLANKSEETLPEFQEKIKQWRKEYYGSLDNSTKKELIESLEGKLRPDIIEQIRRS